MSRHRHHQNLYHLIVLQSRASCRHYHHRRQNKKGKNVTNETTRKCVEENGSGPMSRDANSVQQQKFGSDPNLDNLPTLTALVKPPTKNFQNLLQDNFTL